MKKLNLPYTISKKGLTFAFLLSTGMLQGSHAMLKSGIIQEEGAPKENIPPQNGAFLAHNPSSSEQGQDRLAELEKRQKDLESAIQDAQERGSISHVSFKTGYTALTAQSVANQLEVEKLKATHAQTTEALRAVLRKAEAEINRITSRKEEEHAKYKKEQAERKRLQAIVESYQDATQAMIREVLGLTYQLSDPDIAPEALTAKLSLATIPNKPNYLEKAATLLKTALQAEILRREEQLQKQAATLQTLQAQRKSITLTLEHENPSEANAFNPIFATLDEGVTSVASAGLFSGKQREAGLRLIKAARKELEIKIHTLQEQVNSLMEKTVLPFDAALKGLTSPAEREGTEKKAQQQLKELGDALTASEDSKQ